MIALALGSSVYLWNSETRALVGHLGTSPQPGRPSDLQTRSISCLCWSGDGRALCIGTRRGEMQVKKLLTLKEMSEQRMETDCGVRGGGLCEGKCNT